MNIQQTRSLLDPLASALSSADRRGKRPLVTVTWAQSSNGCIAGAAGQQICISCPQSMALTHLLRSMHDAILVGIGTVMNDNPRLTVRVLDLVPPQHASRHPRPLVLDSRLRIPEDCNLVSSEGCQRPWIFTARVDDEDKERCDKIERLEAAGCRVVQVGEQHVPLPAVVAYLSEHGITSLMVEGGAQVLGSFIDAPLGDYVVVTTSPMHIQNGVFISQAWRERVRVLASGVVGTDSVCVAQF